MEDITAVEDITIVAEGAGGGTKMPACLDLDCPYLDDYRGICTICGTDEGCPLIEDDD